MGRHDLVFIHPRAWRTELAERADLVRSPVVWSWADRRWPLICRRATQIDTGSIAVGLPLPPSAGKRRLAFRFRHQDIVATSGPPLLEVATRFAPHAWRSTLETLDELAASHFAVARVFGSLAWQSLTSLPYLTEHSDLDLLLYIDRRTDVRRLTRDLAGLESRAPFRIDGELMRADGAAASWHELHAGGREILVKTPHSIMLVPTERFVNGESTG